MLANFIATRQRECDDKGVAPDGDLWEMAAEEAGSSPLRCRLLGRFTFPGTNAYLKVHEVFEFTTSNRIHRIKYAYFLVVDGHEVWGYERDPTHVPAEHFHDSSHAPTPHPRISFKEACQRGWDYLTP
jgi:hypothetical protein